MGPTASRAAGPRLRLSGAADIRAAVAGAESRVVSWGWSCLGVGVEVEVQVVGDGRLLPATVCHESHGRVGSGDKPATIAMALNMAWADVRVIALWRW